MRLTWRRLGVLLAHLPRDSAYVQALAGEAGRWGATEHLLAAVVDQLQIGNYLTTRAYFKGTPAVPKPVPRPGDTPGSSGRRLGSGSLNRSQLRTLLDAWRRGKPQPEEVT